MLNKIAKQVKITLTYIKGHSRNVGNEIANEIAKKAAKYGKKINWPISLQFIKKQLNSNLRKHWNVERQQEGNECYTFQWIKNIHKISDHFPTNYYTSQFITGHGRFPFYFHRFAITNNNICKCNLPADSFGHYLQDSPITNKHREQLLDIHKNYLVRRKPELIKDT